MTFLCNLRRRSTSLLAVTSFRRNPRLPYRNLSTFTTVQTRATLASASEPDILVVGGGCAGIACAVALASSSHKVHLIEADCRLGGRARSWEDPVTKHPLHIGPHVVYSDYPNYFKLLSTLGTRERVVWQRDKTVFVTIIGESSNAKRGKTSSSAGNDEENVVSWPIKLIPWLPPPLNWIPAVLRDPWIGLKDILSLVPFTTFILQLHPSVACDDFVTWHALDQISGQELLDGFGVSKAYQEHIMAFVANAILNVPLKEVSGAALVSFFRRLVGRPEGGLGFVDGGLGSVLEPADGFLHSKEGCCVKLGTKLRAIRRVPGEGSTSNDLEVEVEDVETGTFSVVRPKHGVVLTLPALETLQFLPDEVKSAPARTLISMSKAKEACDAGKHTTTSSESASCGSAHLAVQTVLSKFQPCKYISVYLWFDRDIQCAEENGTIRDLSATTISGHQFWAKKYHPSDLCCEFYDFTKIYSSDGPAGFVVTGSEGSALGVNMIDVERLVQQNVLDTTAHVSVASPCSTTGILSDPHAKHFAAESWSDSELVGKALQELIESVPSVKHAKLLRSVVHRIPMAIPRPIQGTEMNRPIPGLISDQFRGLYYAGDWSQTGFPASMEAATQAGFACADEVITMLQKNSSGREQSDKQEQWQQRHPPISDYARISARYLFWPALKKLLAKRLAPLKGVVN